MAQHSSLLHRLLTLLDTGSTQVTRFTAARQIGEIAKSHSQDLISILKKILQYLRSRNWDTRVAAAHALGAIAENVRHTSLMELMSSIESEMLEVGIDDVSKVMGMLLPNVHHENISGLSFISFDINKVLEFGSMLLASAGQEFDVTNDTSKTPAERLARQKQSLRRRLGLDVCEQFMDVSDMIKDEDLLAPKCNLNGNGPNSGYHVTRSGQNIQQLVAAMVPGFRPRRLSARELNLLKRKAKVNAKDHTKYLSEDDELEMSASQHSVASKGTLDKPEANKGFVDAVIHVDKDGHDEDGRWPFQHFVDQLIHDMFDPVWEVRHGSIMALREILSHHGACVGVLSLDFNLEKSFFGDIEGRKCDEIIGESLEFDLNVQFSADEHEPALKRRKSGNGLNYFGNNIYPIESVDGEIKHSASMETAAGINVNPALINGDTVGPHVKVEMEPSPDYLNFHCKVEDDASLGSSAEDSCSISNFKIFLDLPSTSKLKKLIKLARYSRMKNWEFLQDCAIRFLCILSLDRFGDYVADQVVAPVRETCAQALGVVLKYMHPSLVIETLRILLHMQCRQEWEVRHGCLLGIKYLVAVRKEMLQDLLPYILPACKAGLEDPDDDVRAVAADSLIPAAAAIVSLSDNVLHSIVMLLWDILLDLDDLSPSTSSVMNLLSEIYSQPEMAPKMLGTLKADKEALDLNQLSQGRGDVAKYGDNPYVLSKLTPRLWPFMRHSITSVRHSAIRTLERLLEVGNRQSSSESLDNGFWPATILGDALRIVFQNLLLESNDAVLASSERVWRLLLQCPEQDLEAAAKLYFSSWLHLAATPYGSALDASKMFWPTALPRKSHFRAAAKMRVVMGENDSDTCLALNVLKGNLLQEKNRIDVATISPKIIVGADSDKSVTHTRIVTASALGIFVSRLPEVSVPIAIYPIWNDLTSFSGVQRQVASMVLVAWFKELLNHDCENVHGNLFGPLKYVKNWLLDLLGCSDPSFPTKNSLLPYSELSRTYAKMRNEANILFRLAKSCSRLQSYISTLNFFWDTLSIDEAINFTSKLSETIDSVTIERTTMNDLESAKQLLLSTTGYLKCVQNNLHITVSSMAAAAVVWMSDLPAKLNPVILPLMAAVKREQEELLQQKAAEALAELVYSCIGRKPGPNDKLVKNLCILTCADTLETPQAAHIGSMDFVLEDSNIFTLGRLPSIQKSRVQLVSASEDRAKLEGFICRRGAELTLKHLCEKLGPSLFHKIPKLWDCLVEVLKPVHSDEDIHNLEILEMSTTTDFQILINNIQLLRSITPFVDESLKQRLLILLPSVLSCVRHYHIAVRLAASRCIASMAKSMTTSIMRVVIEKAIPMLSDSSSLHGRQGAGMLVTLLVQGLGLELVPYAPLLVVPLLKCMNDCDFSVRQGVTHSFAALVPLLPLARGVPPPSGLSESLSRNNEDAQFLEQLLDNSHIDDYKLPIDIKMNLRRYQQEGINWLSFLRRFKLHGILCDDMGLGKTLQASAIVAADLAEQRAINNGKDPLSLIICPSTLVGHWAYEIDKYIDRSVMLTLQYTGSVSERMPLRGKFDKYNIIITSYDIVRKDIDFLGKLDWNYCILDEGHIIKNSKSKITHAVKQLKAEHRLILSGTPIQNNVLELWSLFDFLMPGFLGTERQFQATYGKPLLAAKDSKCSAKDAEAGILAMEALHKQVMPFLLRRTKDEVLSDLPEKIIQDRYCYLSPVQLRLYEQFSTSDSKREISSLVTESEATSEIVEKVSLKATCHVFQALQYLLKLCSHPLLVIGEKPSESMKGLLAETIPDCSDLLSELHGLHHSPKLVALQEILEECGIGINSVSSEDAVLVGQHRVLIFAQHRSLLDIIERDLFRTHMKSVTFLRLDGSVEPDKRFEIVKTFNSDPTIDVLLLTTHVGGLGLNLTSADTLVFMEHDWNPMKDHQAMDRAHRLGQRKVVNVHRIIMRGTLEEKIMSLQKFKVSVANAVINAENASMKTMNTDQLLDLFTPVSAFGKVAGSDGGRDEGTSAAAGKKGLKALLSGLEELWDQSQYSEEYDLSHFLGKLNNA